jgi:cytochrome c553
MMSMASFVQRRDDGVPPALWRAQVRSAEGPRAGPQASSLGWSVALGQLLLVVGFLLWGTAAWADERRGQALFRLCTACHGSQGEGRIEVGAPAIAGLPEWYVTAQLQKFRQGVRGTHPADIAGMRMRPMARSLPTDTDVLAVAKHVAALPPQTPAPTITGDAANGAQQYLLCLACHGADAAGNEQMGAPPLTIPDDWYLLRQLQNLQQRVRGGNASRDATGAMMQPIASALSEQAMQDVIAYIQTLR